MGNTHFKKRDVHKCTWVSEDNGQKTYQMNIQELAEGYKGSERGSRMYIRPTFGGSRVKSKN